MHFSETGQLLIGSQAFGPWAYGPVFFVLWVGVFWLVKWLVFSLVARAGRRAGTELPATITGSLNLPVVLTIILTGLLVLQRLLPLPPAVDRSAGLVVEVALIAVGLVFVANLSTRLLRLFQPRLDPIDVSRGIVPALIRALVFLIGLLIILDLIGVSITPIVASLGVGSLAVALALQVPLSNVFAGLFLLADKSFNVGDFVELDSGEKGYVERIGVRHTRIRMLPDNVVIVPNAVLIQSKIRNTHLPNQPISTIVQVGVHYDSDLKKVEEVTIDVARRIQQTVEGAVPDFEPFIRYHTFDSSSINFSVILRVKEYVDHYRVKHEFIKALHTRYREEGIVIPFPLRTLDIPDSTADRLRSVFGPAGEQAIRRKQGG